MHILVLLTDLFDAIGGIQTYNRCLVKALSDLAESHDWKVTVLVLNDAQESRNLQDNSDAQRMKYHPFGRSKVKFASSALYYSLKSSVVLLGHVNFTPVCIGIHAIRPAVRLFLIAHGIEVWKRLPILQWCGVQRVSRILSVSAMTRDQMAASNQLDVHKFEVLPNTLDPLYEKTTASASREQLSLPSGKMLLSVARLDAAEQKGIDQVIEALPEILKAVPEAFFVVLGEGSDRPRLEQCAKTAGIREKVIFTGRVSADLLASYYHACDVFVLPSVHEGFGIVFLEAMYQAKPCIGVRVGAVHEVIEHKMTGFITEPGDKKALADVMILLLENDRLRHAMGQAGKDRLKDKFSFEQFRWRLETVINPYSPNLHDSKKRRPATSGKA